MKCFSFSVEERKKKRRTVRMSGGEGGEEKDKKKRRSTVYMWGYLPGATPQRSPILSPEPVPEAAGGGQWRDVCGGGCGFAMAISGNSFILFCLSAMSSVTSRMCMT